MKKVTIGVYHTGTLSNGTKMYSLTVHNNHGSGTRVAGGKIEGRCSIVSFEIEVDRLLKDIENESYEVETK